MFSVVSPGRHVTILCFSGAYAHVVLFGICVLVDVSRDAIAVVPGSVRVEILVPRRQQMLVKRVFFVVRIDEVLPLNLINLVLVSFDQFTDCSY